MGKYFHSVFLDNDLCKGCTNCVRRCPTEAIRVRQGKALIINDKCIDCGECIRICPHNAKKSLVSPLSSINEFKYKIALPAPSLYAQFNTLTSQAPVIGALLNYGFDEVYEVARAAEAVSHSTKIYLKGDAPKPTISSACPAVLRLISVRFPELINNVLPLRAPATVAAIRAKAEAVKKTGLSPEEICTVFITPCPAKVTVAKSPLRGYQSHIDEVISIKDLYPAILPYLEEPHNVTSVLSGAVGIGWAAGGGECIGLSRDDFLAADGIENVIRVLEDLEDDKLHGLTYVELNACPGGCVGGVLAVENPFIAHTKLKKLKNSLPFITSEEPDFIPEEIRSEKLLDYIPVLRLDESIAEAAKKFKQLKEIEAGLYGLDCGCCGAPRCYSLAEDIVRGYATEDYCVYKRAQLTTGIGDDNFNPLPIAFRSEATIQIINKRKGTDNESK